MDRKKPKRKINHTSIYEGIPENISKEEFEERAEVLRNKAFRRIIADTRSRKIDWREEIHGVYHLGYSAKAKLENALGEEVTIPLFLNIHSEITGDGPLYTHRLHLGDSTSDPWLIPPYYRRNPSKEHESVYNEFLDLIESHVPWLSSFGNYVKKKDSK